MSFSRRKTVESILRFWRIERAAGDVGIFESSLTGTWPSSFTAGQSMLVRTVSSLFPTTQHPKIVDTCAARMTSYENIGSLLSPTSSRQPLFSSIRGWLSTESTATASYPPMYTVKGERVPEGYSVDSSLKFAVVEIGGTQYKVTPDDVVVTEKLESVDINDVIELHRVLLLGSTEETLIGRPYIPGASVRAAVEEHFLDGKVLIFHKRRRKNSRRLRGHRQPLTSLRILSIDGLDT